MSSANGKDSLYYINKDVKTTHNNRLEQNALLYPIAKAFFEQNNDYDDIIKTFDYSIDSFKNIINEANATEETIQINNTDEYLKVKIWFENVNIAPPNSIDSFRLSLSPDIDTPNMALAKMGTYTATLIADVHINMTYFNRNQPEKRKMLCDDIVLHEGYYVDIPIPVFSKYCSLRNIDYGTLIKSGEEMEAMYGFFVIAGKIRFIQPVYKKPFNSPVVVRNLYDNQLVRAEVIYTKGFDYENSYFIIGSIVNDKTKAVGRGGASASVPDYIFSLQLNDKTMNRIITTATTPTSARKELINAVPIKYLFYAFGCKTDLEMIKYICPEMNDFALIYSIRNACLQGHKHKEALNIANVRYELKDGDIIHMNEPLDKNLALYIIGQIIFTKETKEAINKQNPKLYRSNIIIATKHILTEKFMPAVGTNTNIDRDIAVCIELGYIVKRLYLIGFQLEPSMSKTILQNRRIRVGQQVEHEFKAFHNARLRDDVLKKLRETVNKNSRDSLQKILTSQFNATFKIMGEAVSNSILKSFKDVNTQSKLKTNMITPKNINFIHGSLREIVISTENKGATVSWEHRDVHQADMFFICPTQSPESGAQAGRFRMPCVYTFLSIATDTTKEIAYLQQHPYYLSTYTGEGLYYIKINGTIVGYVEQYDKVEQLYNDLLTARRKHIINDTTTIVLNHSLGVLYMWCDIGRLLTYFVNVNNSFDIIIDKNKARITPKKGFVEWLKMCSEKVGQFDKGIEEGYIELFDSEMTCYNAVVAGSLKEFYEKPLMYTHIALPNALHGIIAANVPAINMTKGVRCAYITNHTKQAIGPNLRYPQLKYQGDSTILISPQVPLAKTVIYNYKHVGETPYGQNVIIAFMIYKYNQQDSIIVNRASVESGNFLEIDSAFTKLDKIDQDQEFTIPHDCVLNGNADSYTKLDPHTALPKHVGIRFFQNDALIGKITKTPNTDVITDHSTLNTKPDGRYPRSANLRCVRSIVKNYIHDNDKCAKLASFSQFAVPIVGDKVNSECCQKGTVGRIIDTAEMPYTSTGIRPDVIFNPPSVFKRETYDQIYLAMLMKIAALYGCTIDTTPYHTQRTTDEMKAILHELGVNDMGLEDLYDPDTGRKYKCRIFIGMHYYERQPHLVDKKLNIRNGGPRDPMTRIPTKGLKRGGGQSVDTMGVDSLVSAGVHSILADEFLNRAAKIKIGVCNVCHTYGCYYDKNKNAWCCPCCGYHPDIEIKEVPHASNFIRQIFQALHVAVDYYENGESNSDKMLTL